MPRTLRVATEADAPGVQAIYAPFVADTAVSFEYEVPGVDEIRARIARTLPQFPWLVCETDGAVAGYAYGGRHAERAAYQWSADVSVYLGPEHRRVGVGRALYTVLLRLLAAQGYCNAYGGITLPNAASVGLHEAMGFTPVGVYRRVGYKHGAWHDVGWWACTLATPAGPPAPLGSFAALRETPELAAALAAGSALLRG